jgi:hypothetical protein
MIGLLTALLLAASQGNPPPPSGAGACGPIYTAGEKRIVLPHHVYTSQTQADGTTRTGEIISMPDGQYLLIEGKWVHHPLSVSADEALDQHRERFSSQTGYRCEKLRSESVNGVAATVYQMHSETEEGISDGQMWIANKTGLPLKQEVDLEVLMGQTGKSHTSARYEYVNVHKPDNIVEP